jgi:branched-chain amino acid transport system substrate-binding protein
MAAGSVLAISGSPASAASSMIKVGMVNDQTGALAQQFGPNSAGAQAYIDMINAKGGVDGHKITFKIYDGQSSDSTVESDFKLAISNGTFGFIESEPLMTASVPYLEAQGVPVVGFGVVPSFYGPAAKNFFGTFGDVITKTTSEWAAHLVKEGKKNIAVLSDTNPGDSTGAKSWAATVPKEGGKLVYTNYTVNSTNASTLLAIAQRLKADDVQAVISDAGDTQPQLEVDLHQVGDDTALVEGGSLYTITLGTQLGSGADGYTYGSFVAPLTDTKDVGVKQYLTAMKKYEPKLVYNGQASDGWASAALFVEGLKELGSATPTAPAYVKKMDALNGFTATNFMPPVHFPTFRTAAGPCLSFSQLSGGKWKVASGTPADPFSCGASYPPGAAS